MPSLNIHYSMATEKTQAADEDRVTLLKAPEQVDLELKVFCQLAAIFLRPGICLITLGVEQVES